MTSPPKPRPLVRAVAAILWLLMLLLLVEGSSRAFWRIRYRVSFVNTRGNAQSFYPELVDVLAARPTRRDGIVDVLLLGGSTVSRSFGSVPQALQELLSTATGHRVRIFDLAFPAHTSRDSYYKYRALAPVRFDLVIVYDGFNEVRANNVPPGLFRDDYSHYSWYELIGDVLERHRLWPFATPYTAVYLVRTLRDSIAKRAGHPRHAPKGRPDSSWTAYGRDIRTPEPFRHNLETILNIAKARGDPVLLLTFAAYFAPGYSEATFRAHTLDYATHQLRTEFWGRPEYVAAALAAHNAVIRDLHATHPDVGFVDLETAIPHQATYFNDVCHLTVRGSEQFAEAVLPAALSVLRHDPILRPAP